MRLDKKVALITGGYGGMGRASARLFAREGATVFIAGRSHERGDALVAEISSAGGKAHFIELDVANQENWNSAVTQVKEQAGALHVLMNIVQQCPCEVPERRCQRVEQDLRNQCQGNASRHPDLRSPD